METSLDGGSVKTSLLYCIIPLRCGFVKVGRWSGSINNLRSRYQTCYGRFAILIFEVDDSVASERRCFECLKAHHYTNELFELTAVDAFLEFGERNARTYVTCDGYIRGARNRGKPKVFSWYKEAGALQRVPREVLLAASSCSTWSSPRCGEVFTEQTHMIREVVTALGLQDPLDYDTSFIIEERKGPLMATQLFRFWEAKYPLFNRHATSKDSTTFDLRRTTDTLRSVFLAYGVQMVARRVQSKSGTTRIYSLDAAKCRAILAQMHEHKICPG